MRSRDSFDTMFGFFRVFFILAFIGVIAMFVLRGTLVYNAMKGGKTMYQIEVNSFNQHETYLTSEFTKDEKTGCLTFKDELGIKRIVCNQYTITQY